MACWFQCWKNTTGFFDHFCNTGDIDANTIGSALEDKPSFKRMGLALFSKFEWSSSIISIVKNSSEKVGALILSIKFLLLRLLCIFLNLPYGHTWNAVVMSGLLPLAATWNCYISYKTDMQDCWFYTYCLSLTLDSSSKCSQFKSFL